MFTDLLFFGPVLSAFPWWAFESANDLLKSKYKYINGF